MCTCGDSLQFMRIISSIRTHTKTLSLQMQFEKHLTSDNEKRDKDNKIHASVCVCASLCFHVVAQRFMSSIFYDVPKITQTHKKNFIQMMCMCAMVPCMYPYVCMRGDKNRLKHTDQHER